MNKDELVKRLWDRQRELAALDRKLSISEEIELSSINNNLSGFSIPYVEDPEINSDPLVEAFTMLINHHLDNYYKSSNDDVDNSVNVTHLEKLLHTAITFVINVGACISGNQTPYFHQVASNNYQQTISFIEEEIGMPIEQHPSLNNILNNH